MTTEAKAASRTKAAAEPEPTTWRLDGDTGSMAPRSALDVLVDLNDKVVSGQLAEYQRDERAPQRPAIAREREGRRISQGAL